MISDHPRNSSTNIYLGLNTVLSISKCKACSKIIGQKTQVKTQINALLGKNSYVIIKSAPIMAGPTIIHRGEGWCRHRYQNVGQEGGHKLQLRTIRNWV